MDKKRSIGVTVFSVLSIIIGLAVLTFNIRVLASRPIGSMVILACLFGLACIISGIFLIRLKAWARNLFLVSMLIWSFLGAYSLTGRFAAPGRKLFIDFSDLVIVSIFFILPAVLSFYFFSCPEVRKQFKG